MSKVFTILGIIFAAIIALIGIVAAVFIPHALKLDHDATAYIQDAVPKIVAHWNSQELVDRATPELLATASRKDMDDFFVECSKLGALKHLDTPEGTVNTSAYTGTGITTVGHYQVQADFENAPAILKIQLLRVGDSWRINGFHISSKILK